MKNNMNDEKQEWMENVFQSMKGSQRAKPENELLAKIQKRIGGLETRVVSMRQVKYVAAAAVLILLMNTTTLVYFNQQKQMDEEEIAIETNYGESLISSFQIYE